MEHKRWVAIKINNKIIVEDKYKATAKYGVRVEVQVEVTVKVQVMLMKKKEAKSR